jgi:hypothetical protein
MPDTNRPRREDEHAEQVRSLREAMLDSLLVERFGGPFTTRDRARSGGVGQHEPARPPNRAPMPASSLAALDELAVLRAERAKTRPRTKPGTQGARQPGGAA